MQPDGPDSRHSRKGERCGEKGVEVCLPGRWEGVSDRSLIVLFPKTNVCSWRLKSSIAIVSVAGVVVTMIKNGIDIRHSVN